MTNVKISVLMPVYNGGRYLRTAIESVLCQTFHNFEFIVVDDGSTDASAKIIKEYAQTDKRIIYIRNHTHLGTTKSLNKGLSEARGKYIVRMDADDFSYPDRLQNQLGFMETHKDVGVSGGEVQVCDENLNIRFKRKYPFGDREIRKIIFFYSPFAHSSTIWNRKKMMELGGYNENFALSQDAELYFKVGKISKFANLKKVLIKLRMHENSNSFSKNAIQERLAIYARIKGIVEYGYKVRLLDWFYIFFRIVVMVIVPTNLKFKLFNFLRRQK